MFEYVYFMNAAYEDESGVSIAKQRACMGRQLALDDLADGAVPDVDVIAPVPNTGRPAALAYAKTTGAADKYAEVLSTQRKTKRSFLLGNQYERSDMVDFKFDGIRDLIDGQRILLIDDSLVRGTTLNKLLYVLQEYGAEDVHMRLHCPPIITPCERGIDFPTREELAASAHSRLPQPELEEKVRLDLISGKLMPLRDNFLKSLHYLSLDSLKSCIGETHCFNCLLNC